MSSVCSGSLLLAALFPISTDTGLPLRLATPFDAGEMPPGLAFALVRTGDARTPARLSEDVAAALLPDCYEATLAVDCRLLSGEGLSRDIRLNESKGLR